MGYNKQKEVSIMDYINEKVSYLKGLCDGLEIDDSTKEGKVFVKIIDILEDLTDAVEGLQEAYDDIEDYVELIDEDLMEVEDELYDLDILEDEDDNLYDEDDDDFLDEDDIYEIECPNCGAEFITDFDDMEDEDFQIECPECGYVLDIMDLMCECDDDCECECGQIPEEDEEL
jgi:DNA-directed RNA polymerase subunit RPC12/RpoP